MTGCDAVNEKYLFLGCNSWHPEIDGSTRCEGSLGGLHQIYGLEVLMTPIVESTLEADCLWFLRCWMAGLRRAQTYNSTTGPKTNFFAPWKPHSLQSLDRQQAAWQSCEPETLGAFPCTAVAAQLPKVFICQQRWGEKWILLSQRSWISKEGGVLYGGISRFWSLKFPYIYLQLPPFHLYWSKKILIILILTLITNIYLFLTWLESEGTWSIY